MEHQICHLFPRVLHYFQVYWLVVFTIYLHLISNCCTFSVVFILTYIVNQFTGGFRYISFQEQVIMVTIVTAISFFNLLGEQAYGGLRGAVSFSLAFMLPDDLSTKKSILFATYIVILFTVFGQVWSWENKYSCICCFRFRITFHSDSYVDENSIR